MGLEFGEYVGASTSQSKVFEHVLVEGVSFKEFFDEVEIEFRKSQVAMEAEFFPGQKSPVIPLDFEGCFISAAGDKKKEFRDIDSFLDAYSKRQPGLYQMTLFITFINSDKVTFAQSVAMDKSRDNYDSYLDLRIVDTTEKLADHLLRIASDIAGSHQLEEPDIPPELPEIFIGHGRSTQWMTIRDFLRDQMQYSVHSYESENRTSEDIKEILEKELSRNNYAVLVMTGEDELKDGTLLPRQNVVHELGLFESRMGFNRVFVLVETGTKIFTNIDGLQYIDYPKGDIVQAEGKLAAAINKLQSAGSASSVPC
ncbi:TIR domain-containing protein [Bifidobacterium sp.]|uniref:TIR domain-containing protein n=1 Tax=Bifidobacterium sp. TaxID=41200 RepID=UPI0039EA0678